MPTSALTPRAILALAAALGVAPALARASDFLTHSAAEITTALASAHPGDNIIMANGTWTDQNINFYIDGNAANHVTLKAETPGRVILNGASRVNISGAYLDVSGLEFRGGALAAGQTIVRFTGSRGDATNSRLTNCAFIDYNPVDEATRYFWVGVNGQDNRVDHNFFRGQNNSGVTVVVYPIVGVPNRAHIDNNQFVDRPVGSTGNGYETIRVGTSDVQSASAQVVVENNLFERTNGEVETISNKSSDSIFRYNTFRNVQGTLTLRHGSHDTVEGNFFLGQSNSNSGGIRVIGPNHIITNNFIADVGNRADGAISIEAGDSDFSETSGSNTSGYEPVKNVQIVNNTIINSKAVTIRLSEDYKTSGTSNSVLPSNVTIANNLLYTKQTTTFAGTLGSGFVFAGNIASGGSLGISSRPGIAAVNPLVSRDGRELYRYPANSPAVNGGSVSATGAWTVPTTDMDGQTRTGLPDVGADEFITDSSGIVHKPLYGGDVGPSWLTRRTYDIDNYVVPILHVEAENYTAVTDPNADGLKWQTTITADGRTVLKAPAGPVTNIPGTQDTVAEFDMAVHDAGTYFLTAVIRALDTSSDSIYVPATLGADPTIAKTIPNLGTFTTVQLGTYTITTAQQNEPITLMIGRREGNVEIDSIMLTPNMFPDSVPEPGYAGLIGATVAAMSGRRRR